VQGAVVRGEDEIPRLENLEKRHAFRYQYLQKTSPNTLIGLKGDFSAP